MEYIDLKAQHKRLSADIQRRLAAVFEHSRYIMGPEVQELEERLATYVGVKHCITVSNGTTALLLAMMALGVKAGDEVITTPFSFVSPVEMTAVLGAKPVLVDIDPKTYNLDPAALETAITPKTKLIIPVNLFGQCADYDAINAIASKHNVMVIEDAAQSFGATYKGRQSCGLSLIGCTSFFPSKPLSCYGDGGACFTNDDELAKTIRRMSNHGQEGRYHHVSLGFNGRLDTIQAAVLLAKLSIFDGELALRTQVANRYTQLLADVVQTPYVAPYNTSVFAQYTLEFDNRDEICAALKENNIPTAIHYPKLLNQQPAYANVDMTANSLPHANKAVSRVVSLPFHPYLKGTEQEAVVRVIDLALQTNLLV